MFDRFEKACLRILHTCQQSRFNREIPLFQLFRPPEIGMSRFFFNLEQRFEKSQICEDLRLLGVFMAALPYFRGELAGSLVYFPISISKSAKYNAQVLAASRHQYRT